MTSLLRPLFERWLLAATEAPLTPWKRALLQWALQRDQALRVLALELAAFEHEASPHAPGLPDLRPRLRAILAEKKAPARQLLPAPWLPLGALAGLGLAALLIDYYSPKERLAYGELAKAQDTAVAQALAIPSPTLTTTPTATPTLTPTSTATPGAAEAAPTPEAAKP